ncbi:hypothetical protein [Rubrivirga sp.]|uniref:hypothetical protein n=1 Tax=Rubrivirga sp. TaxID=1885344 RepID=UPI003B52E82F
MSPSAPATRRVSLDFDPARDGFSFGNRYTWTDDDLGVLAAKLRAASALPVTLGAGLGGAVSGPVGGAVGLAVGAALGRAGLGDGIVRSVARRWSTFGLCGGMALAAIERWPQGPGAVATADLKPEPLRALLRRRQERTLRASLPRFAGWWLRALASPNPDGWADALRRELDRVEARLGAGRPALLGLVGDAPDPFALHQVVAFGVERRGPLAATLSVYDPNAPGQTRTVTTAPTSPGRASIATTLPTGRAASGRAHISTRPNHLAHVFVIDA